MCKYNNFIYYPVKYTQTPNLTLFTRVKDKKWTSASGCDQVISIGLKVARLRKWKNT